MNVLRVIVQIIDCENGQRSDPRQGTREAISSSLASVIDKDEKFKDCFVLVVMEEVEKDGETGFQYSLAPLLTVEKWIEFFPVAQEVI